MLQENQDLIKNSIVTEVTVGPGSSSEHKGKVVKKSGKRIGYYYIIVKSLKESQKNDVVRCIYIKGLSNFGFCVIKEGSYGDTKDKQGRDIIDRLKWQKQLHEELQDDRRFPKLLGSFEENGNYYLVIERIKGKPLHKVVRESRKKLKQEFTSDHKKVKIFLNYVLQIIGILDELHKRGIVHRDITSSNFIITPAGSVRVIDMELSYSLPRQFPSPPFQLGTYGYMSPEQAKTSTPTVLEDIYSVGAIMFFLWTGISPNKIADTPVDTLLERVRFFVRDEVLADVIVKCLQPLSENRPSLVEVQKIVSSYQSDLEKKVIRRVAKPGGMDKDQLLMTIQDGINALATPLFADDAKGWFSENMNTTQNGERNKLNKSWYASFNRGAAGIIYFLSQAKVAGFDITPTIPYIEKGLELIEEKYIIKNDNASPGMHFGADGIAASLAAAIHGGIIDRLPKYLAWIDILLGKDTNLLGIMDGVAGQGLSCLICDSFIEPEKLSLRLQKYVDYLMSKQEKDGSWIRSITGKKKRISRGFGNGIAGIVYFLLSYWEWYRDEKVLASAQRGIRWLMKDATRRKDTVEWLSSTGKEIAPSWCDGAPGIGLTFLKAYDMLGDASYASYARQALNSHNINAIDGNLSQCYGLSGIGEVYLEAHRVLKEDQWMERAGLMAQVIMQLKREHVRYGPYWIVEDESQPVANFMLGNAGILYYLFRYYYPDCITLLLSGNR